MDVTYIKDDTFEKISLKEATKQKKIKINIIANDGSFEHYLDINVDRMAKDYFFENIIKEVKQDYCFVSANFYLNDKEIRIVDRPAEPEKETDQANEIVKAEELKNETVNEEKPQEEEIQENQEVVEEAPKELTEEEIAQKKIEEEEAAKRVPEDLLDKKIYFMESEEYFDIFNDAKLGHILHEIISVQREFNCLLIRPSEVSSVQLFDRVQYRLSDRPGCSFTCNQEIYLLGISLYGPFPNSNGVSAYDFELKIHNSSTKESRKVSAKVEDQKEQIFKYFLDRPLNVRKHDTVNVTMISGQGAVYVLDSDLYMFIGDDDVQFRLYNHLNNMIPSLYYCKPADP